MGWYIAAVTSEYHIGRAGILGPVPEGWVIVDSVTGGIVRPCTDHPQSMFSEDQIRRIAAHLTTHYGDPRKGEHTIDKATLDLILTGAEG